MRFFIAVLFILFSICCTAQKQANIWYFGYYAGLDFRSGTPVALNNSAMWTNEASSVISDNDGNLLFYTDGVTVWNRNNKPMPSGHHLWGDEETSQTLIVPQPGNDSLFYIFTASPNYDYVFGPGTDSVGFHYSIVNINKANGLGDVVQKNVLLFKNTTEKMTAVFHANSKDVWLVTHEWGNNFFRSYLVTKNGIDSSNVVISKTGVIHSGSFSNYPDANANATGQMKLSPDGKKIAFAIGLLGVQVFDFDNSTGEINNPTSLLHEEGLPCTNSFFEYGGVEFSPNSNFLYYTVGWGGGALAILQLI